MKIGVLKCNNENLVALTPKSGAKFINDNFSVVLEKSAGEASHYYDNQYEEVGISIASREEVIQKSDILLTGTSINKEDFKSIPTKTFLIGRFNARVETEFVSKLKNAEFRSFSLDMVPRTTLAQSMDVLSSLASLSGYKAVITGAEHFGGYLPMMTTSAGTIPPAKILILGAGVAGLQAIATGRRLGAVVEAFDVRSSVKEEVESLGAKFIEIEGSKEDLKAGGYAVEQTEEYIQKQKDAIHERASKADIIITTANIPGKKAPLLIEKRSVENMKAGSVIVDMATASGGNCEVSKDESIIDYNGVKIIGDSKLYNILGNQASYVYSNNISSFLNFLFKNGEEMIPWEHEIVTNTLITKKEEK